MAKKIENPFKKLEESLKEVPPHMKKKIMGDVARAKLVIDLASLFTINVKSIIEGMFKTNIK